MRPLPAALLAALAVACAPSEQTPADTAAPVGAAVDAARSPDATATPLPAPPESAGRPATPAPSGTAGAGPARTSGVTPATRGTATDTTTGPRIRPPSKAPGGYIIVPNTAHDSLRMAPPAPGTTTGTSTRP